MPESQNKEKKTCKFEFGDYKCNRTLYDKKHCIFHSWDRKEKKEPFMKAFWNEYHSQKEKGKLLMFNDFVFPKWRGDDLWGAQLQGAKLQRTMLNWSDFQVADLTGADLREADLRRANLQGTDLIKADLRESNLQGANLRRANLQGANLQEANLQGADLRRANLQGANLQEANLQNSKLHVTNLKNVNLKGADLTDSSFEKAIVKGVKYDRSTIFSGAYVDQALGNPQFVREAKDQQFLEEFKSKNPRIYKIWNVFADCGRSFLRWALWSLLFAVVFALIYEIIYFCSPATFKADFISPTWSGISFLYYSIVTFTTLGFGDIVPKSPWVQLLVTLEVILGYVMLGGLISIFANKLARRS
jgi:uncharacterized protein YjbI with pentapeptide repeats